MALTPQQIETIWVNAGGKRQLAPFMAKIAMRESSDIPTVDNKSSGAAGLWQVLPAAWSKDPVIGPMFRNGQIHTAQGNAKAAVRIMALQGPKAWATYNPATDAKYLGGMPGGPIPAASSVGPRTHSPVTTAVPDATAMKKVILARFLQHSDPDNMLLRLGVVSPNLPTTQLVKTSSAPPSSGAGSPAQDASSADTSSLPKGVAHFDGRPVAKWILPYLSFARQHGWQGSISSGYRTYAEQAHIYNSGVRPAAKPGTSNHEMTAFPGGAVDVTNAQQLNDILQHYPGPKLLQWAGAKDPVHFSHPHDGGY